MRDKVAWKQGRAGDKFGFKSSTLSLRSSVTIVKLLTVGKI